MLDEKKDIVEIIGSSKNKSHPAVQIFNFWVQFFPQVVTNAETMTVTHWRDWFQTLRPKQVFKEIIRNSVKSQL